MHMMWLVRGFPDSPTTWLLKELVSELSGMGGWAPVASDGDYEPDPSLETRNCYEELASSISSVRKLLKQDVSQNLLETYHAMLFTQVITIMETYLGDRIAQFALHNAKYKRRFWKTIHSSKGSEVKIKTSEIFERFENIDADISEKLGNIAWHNLERIKPIYVGTLGIDFGEFSHLRLATIKRHDFVHRNGRDKEGYETSVQKQDVRDLADAVDIFAQKIEAEIASQNL